MSLLLIQTSLYMVSISLQAFQIHFSEILIFWANLWVKHWLLAPCCETVLLLFSCVSSSKMS